MFDTSRPRIAVLGFVGLAGTITAVRGYYRAAPWLTVSLVLLGALSGLLLPAFMVATGWLVEAVANGRPATFELASVAAIFGLQRLIEPLNDAMYDSLWTRTDESIARRIMTAVSAPPGLQELEDPRVLDKITQAEGAVTGLTVGQTAQMFGWLVPRRVTGIACLVIVGFVYWWAAMLLLLVYLLAFEVTGWHLREVTLVMFERTDALRRSYYLRRLALSSDIAKETRIFGLSGWLVQRYREGALSVLRDVWRKRNEGWLAALGLFGLVGVVEAVTLGMLAVDGTSGRISIATVVATAQALLGAGALSLYQEPELAMVEAEVGLKKIADLESSTHITTEYGTRPADDLPQRRIRLENVSFTYPGRGESVFDGFNLDIEVGHSLAIVGENGAGKTTLVKLVTGLYQPTGGRILVDNVDLRELDPASWHRRVAAVFQDFARFELPAYDNVAFGALRARDDAAAVQRAASDAGALPIIERLEHGWQTTLSREFRHGAEISGGEWQRLALARALFAVSEGAGLLILDEPTASLDVRGESEIYTRFLELTRGITTIVISHRFSTVRRADRIVVIEGGRVTEDGMHEQLIAHGGRYASMYALQAARFSENEPDGA